MNDLLKKGNDILTHLASPPLN